MQLTTPQLERIVTEVMVELLRPVAKQTAPARVEPVRPVVAPAPVVAERVVVIAERVVTGAMLEERARGAKRITVPPSAVLTPSARDFVRKHAVEIARETPGTKSTREAVRWQLLVSKAGSSVLAAAEAWTKECGWRTRQLVGTAREAATKAISVVGAAEAAGVIVVTDRPDEACLLANRNDKVRAVVVHTVRGMQSSVELVGPNVFVVDPSGRGLFELKQLLVQIVKSGKPASKLGALN